MRATNPPWLGVALLERFGPRNDALLGDFAEEYRRGRSVFWYWRQVTIAITIGGTDDIRQHWLLAQ